MWFAFSPIFFVNVPVNASHPPFLCHSVKINSHILCISYWLISFLRLPILDKMLSNFTVFRFTFESVTKIHQIMQANGSSSIWKLQVVIWNFPNSELQKTHFNAFYSLTLLLFWQIVLNNNTLIFLIGRFLALYLYFVF